MRARDLFAGAGGWDFAARDLGWHVDGAEIMKAARITRKIAGFSTPWADVRDVRGVPGEYDVEIASPPCQTFSLMGDRSGLKVFHEIEACITALAEGNPFPKIDDERTSLVVEPLRVALESEAPYIAWEQVPTVLPVWDKCAKVFRSRGYEVATGILGAEQYGVPQTRRRAVLMARRDGIFCILPKPTHSRFNSRNPREQEPNLLPYVSMGEALKWKYGTEALQRGNGSGSGGVGKRTAAERGRVMRDMTMPAATVTSKSWQWETEGERVTSTLEDAEILQTFSPSMLVAGDASDRRLQIGNAVPPVLAKAILSTLVAKVFY